MTLSTTLTRNLVLLAHALLADAHFGSVESIANFLNANQSGAWQALPDDEKLHWVQTLGGMLGPSHGLLTQSKYEDLEALQKSWEMIFHYEEHLVRKLSD